MTIARALALVGAVLAVGAAFAGGFVLVQTRAYDASMNETYDVPIPSIERSTDPAVLARGKHLAESIASCATRDCHGTDLGGGKTISMGPVADFTAPNISASALGAAYTDGELFRLIRHGIKKDGRSVTFMPSREFGWLPDSDIVAVISWMRTMPGVERANGPVRVGALGKVLDRADKLPFDVARRIDHANVETAQAPSATAEYGRFVARLCTGCHGERLSGGAFPGAPASMPVPLNLTPHDSGMKGWTYEDFDRLMTKGVRKNGKPLDPFMPVAAWASMDETEKKALFLHLERIPPLPFGGR